MQDVTLDRFARERALGAVDGLRVGSDRRGASPRPVRRSRPISLRISRPCFEGLSQQLEQSQ